MPNPLHAIGLPLIFLLTSCAASGQGKSEPRLELFPIVDLPMIGTTKWGQDILLGGFSGLHFEGRDAASGNWLFVTHTDRGPNPGPVSGAQGMRGRPFALPGFQPRWVRLELDSSKKVARWIGVTPLRDAKGTSTSGIPNLLSADESPLALDGKSLSFDPIGLDLEGIVKMPGGEYWMVDEYRPSICRFSPEGELLARFVPAPKGPLPEVFASRKQNRGFEGIAVDGTKIYAFMQSPLESGSAKSRVVRILEFDSLAARPEKQFAYLFDEDGTDRLGDAVGLGNGRFLVIEHDGQRGSQSRNRIYRITLQDATDLSVWKGKSPESMGVGELAAAGIRTVRKDRIADLAALGFAHVDKLEGIALINDSTIALINDDDFGLAGPVDLRTGKLQFKDERPSAWLGILRLPRPISEW